MKQSSSGSLESMEANLPCQKVGLLARADSLCPVCISDNLKLDKYLYTTLQSIV